MAEVNWGLVRRVANRVARVPAIDEIADLPAGVTVEEAARRVGAYTGIEVPTDLPVREILSRSDWIAAALDRERLVLPLRESAEDRDSRWWERSQIASKVSLCLSDLGGVAVGVVLGREATSKMGQYLRVPKPVTVAPRLLLVGPNVARKAESLGIDIEDLVSWVTIHEVTHVLQFAGIPWLDAYHEDGENRLRELNGQPGASGDELRAVKEQVVVLGEVMEGHAEHVTDVVMAEIGSLPSFDEQLRSLWLRLNVVALKMLIRFRPSYRGRTVEWHHTPYKAGFNFCNFVAKAGAFAELFRSPETLPNVTELVDPAKWLARIRQ